MGFEANNLHLELALFWVLYVYVFARACMDVLCCDALPPPREIASLHQQAPPCVVCLHCSGAHVNKPGAWVLCTSTASHDLCCRGVSLLHRFPQHAVSKNMVHIFVPSLLLYVVQVHHLPYVLCAPSLQACVYVVTAMKTVMVARVGT